MSIRDEKLRWKPIALTASTDIRNALKPIYKKYKDVFTFEDIYYLISSEAQEIIIGYAFDERE